VLMLLIPMLRDPAIHEIVLLRGILVQLRQVFLAH